MTDLPAPTTLSAPTTDDPDAFESEASRLASVPLWILVVSGTLRLANGRLSFRTRTRTLFDAPLSEIHSVAENAFGIVFWHGATKHRFTFGRPASIRLYSNNLAIIASALPKTFDDARTARGSTTSWLRRLEPVVGFPPPGMVVPRPWRKWKTWLVITGVVLGLFATITAGVLIQHALA